MSSNGILLYAGVASTTIAVAGVVSWRNSILNDKSGRVSKKLPKPEDLLWLDQATYDTLIAICDTFAPTYHSNLDCTKALLQAEIDKFGPLFDVNKTALSVHNALLNMEHLQRGAVECDVPYLMALTVQNFVYKFDQNQLFILLKLLSTSLGSMLLCQMPAPFKDLPLKYREIALKRIRDSPIADFRSGYQTYKKLCNNIFNAYAKRGKVQRLFVLFDTDFLEPGEVNRSWAALQYNPEEQVNKVPPPMQKLDDATDLLLRQRISLASVLKELKALNAVTTEGDIDVITVDVVVVGSGSGGGTIASQLVLAGLNVLVLEKGGYFRAADFKLWRESEAFQHLFERSGTAASADGNIAVLAGSCVGGGSTLNWSASFRPPKFVREDWVKAGLIDFEDGGAFDVSLDAVHQNINVNTKCSHTTEEEKQEQANLLCRDSESGACSTKTVPFVVNNNNRLLWESATKLGYTPEKIPRNVKQCVDCGHCCHGCVYESKQSTITALLEPLILQQASGTKPVTRGQLYIIPDCHVDKVLYESMKSTQSWQPTKKAVGVSGVVTLLPECDLNAESRAANGDAKRLNRPLPIGTRKIQVNARIVVSSAGSLHTPALLLRSGFKHPMIGKGLTLHPVLGVAGMQNADVNTGLHSGVSMGVVVKQPLITANTVQNSQSGKVEVGKSNTSSVLFDDEERHPVAIETPPLHPGLLGLLLPWQGGLQFKIGCLAWPNLAVFIGIARDRSSLSNRVTINAHGQPVVNYKMASVDMPMMMAGLEASMRMMYAAGSKLIFIGHENFPWYSRSDKLTESENAEQYEAFIKAAVKEGIQAGKSQVFSAHQMSSCRMSANHRDGCTRPTGELYECQNLYLADGSIVPTSLGVNPMVTIEAFAHLVAQKVIEEVKEGKLLEDLKPKVLAAHQVKNQTKW